MKTMRLLNGRVASLFNKAEVFMGHRKTAYRGQVAIEFTVMAVICSLTLAVFVGVLGYYSEYVWRILALISLDYP